MENKQQAGWMPLKEWAGLTTTDWKKALALANPNSRRTGKVFHPADVDRLSNQEIKVWYTPPHPLTGARRPRTVKRLKRVNPSNDQGTEA